MSELSGEKHWVEELFPPTYSYRIDDPVTQQGVSFSPPSSVLFCRWLRDWLPFPRARHPRYIADRQTDEQKTESLNEGEQQHGEVDCTKTAVMIASPDISEKDMPPVSLRSIAADTCHEASVEESVWTWSELCAIREQYQSFKSANIHLELRVDDLSQQLEMDRRKLSEVFHVAERQYALIQKMRRENEQLRVQLVQQKDENVRAKQQSQELDMDKTKLVAALHNAEEKLHRLELTVAEKEEQIVDLHLAVQNERAREKVAVETAKMSLEVQHEEKVKKMREELARMRLELEVCQETHSRDKKALNQLRRHFAGPAMSRLPSVDCVCFEYNC